MTESNSSNIKTPKDLRNYQIASTKFILKHPRVMLAERMGLGKTVATLTAIKYLINRFQINNVLVIAPLRVARKVWSDEIRDWTHLPDLKISKIIGNAETRSTAMEAHADIHLINFENVLWLVNHFKRKGDTQFRRPWPWDMIVVDESSGFKNQHTQRWKALRRVIQKTTRVVELTGTPAPNGLVDLWAQVYLLDYGKRLGKTLTAFRERWFSPPGYGQFKWMPYAHAEKEIHERLKDIVFSLNTDDFLELPPVMYNTIRVDLTSTQMNDYLRMEKMYFMKIGEKEITAVSAGVLFGKLLQLANGAIYTNKEGDWELFHDAKLDALQEIIEVTPGNVMVVHNFRADLARIQKRLLDTNINFRKLDKPKDEDDWNAGKIRALLLHPKSAGHGLNLQHGGETIVWFGLNPSLELYEQASARIAGGLRRLGKNVEIHHIVTDGTIDEVVMDMIAQKEATQNRLLDALNRRKEVLGL